MMLEHGDIGMGARLVDEGALHLPGRIRRMDDAPHAMPALPRQMISRAVVMISGKRHALPDQPLDGLGSVFHHVAGHRLVTKAGPATSVSRIAGFGESSSDSVAAMPPWAQPLAPSSNAFGDESDLPAGCQIERKRQAGETAADDQVSKCSCAREFIVLIQDQNDTRLGAAP